MAANARDWRRQGWSVTLGAVAVVGSATAAIIGASLSIWPAPVDLALDGRHMLWRDTLLLRSRSPVIGSGPGSFQRLSALTKNPDLAMAHCSILQIGAETGLICVGLIAAILALGFVLTTQVPPAVTMVTASAVAALAVHSFASTRWSSPQSSWWPEQ